jgi:hypothetical protein
MFITYNVKISHCSRLELIEKKYKILVRRPQGNKGKAIPVTGREDPQGTETSKLPYFLDGRLTD